MDRKQLRPIRRGNRASCTSPGVQIVNSKIMAFSGRTESVLSDANDQYIIDDYYINIILFIT